MQSYDEQIDKHLRDCLMSIVPCAGERRSLPKAVMAAKMLIAGEVVTAQRGSLQKDLRDAAELLEEIGNARGPSGAEVNRMSLFTAACLKKCEILLGTMMRIWMSLNGK